MKILKMFLLSFAFLCGMANFANAALVYSDSQENTTSAYTFTGYLTDDYVNIFTVPSPVVSWSFEAVYDDIIGGYAVMTITDFNNDIHYVGFNADGEGNSYRWSEYEIYYEFFFDLNDPFLAWFAAIQNS